MDSFKKLLESNLLSPETAEVLETEFKAVMEAKDSEHQAALQEAVENARTETMALVTESIKNAAVDVISDYTQLVAEAAEQEVIYEAKLQEFKDDYDSKAIGQIAEAVELAVNSRVEELKEDVELFKKCSVAVKLAENFADATNVFQGNIADDELTSLRESKRELEQMKISAKISELTSIFTEGSHSKNIATKILENCKSVEEVEVKFPLIKESVSKLDNKVESDEQSQKLDESDKGQADDTTGTVVLENVEHQDGGSTLDEKGRAHVDRALKNLNLR